MITFSIIGRGIASYFRYPFIVFAKCLGVDIFKRYWTVGGSAWNSKRINKNSIKDLEGVISDSYDYTRQHIRTFTISVGVSIPFLFMEYQNKNLTLGVIGSLIFIELYSFMVHLYNRLLAWERIDYLRSQGLVKEDDGEEVTDKEKFNNSFDELKVTKSGCFYRLFCEVLWFSVGPLFRTEELANEYKIQLMSNYETLYDLYIASFKNKNDEGTIIFPRRY